MGRGRVAMGISILGWGRDCVAMITPTVPDSYSFTPTEEVDKAEEEKEPAQEQQEEKKKEEAKEEEEEEEEEKEEEEKEEEVDTQIDTQIDTQADTQVDTQADTQAVVVIVPESEEEQEKEQENEEENETQSDFYGRPMVDEEVLRRRARQESRRKAEADAEAAKRERKHSQKRKETRKEIWQAAVDNSELRLAGAARLREAYWQVVGSAGRKKARGQGLAETSAWQKRTIQGIWAGCGWKLYKGEVGPVWEKVGNGARMQQDEACWREWLAVQIQRAQ